MDITSPALLKFKALLFLLLAAIAAGLVFAEAWPMVSWRFAGYFALSIWACCRAYYFCFYVLQHYADPTFRYTGLMDLLLHLTGVKGPGGN